MMQEKQLLAVLVYRCFVVRRKKELLIVRRALDDSNNPGKWEPPGGKLNIGLLNALHREVDEEVGLSVRITCPDVFVTGYIITDDGKYKDLPYIVMFGVAESVGSSDVRLSEEHIDYAWVSYDEMLQNYNLTSETKAAAPVLKPYLM